MIAMALATEPRLPADEPTTGLDVSIGARILELLRQLGEELGAAIILVTHDLGVVAQTCHRVAATRRAALELARSTSSSSRRCIPIRRRWSARSRASTGIALSPIAGAVPSLINVGRAAAMSGAPGGARCVAARPALIAAAATTGRLPCHGAACRSLASGARQHFPVRGIGWLHRRGPAPVVRAVDGISFDIDEGRTLGLVGESGCGKSTVARRVTRLLAPTAGTVRVRDRELDPLEGEPLREARRDARCVPGPLAALNPRMSVERAVSEPLRLHTDLSPAQQRERCARSWPRWGCAPRDGA